MNVVEDTRIKFIINTGRECFFVKTIKDKILAWEKDCKGEYICRGVSTTEINKNQMVESGLWDELPIEIKNKVKTVEDQKAEHFKEKMAHARSMRKGKHTGLPTELKCECGSTVKANWTILKKKADKLGVDHESLVTNYKCQKCNPTKGRKKKS